MDKDISHKLKEDDDELLDALLNATTEAGTISISSNSNLGITKEYNKENRDRLWDSTKQKEEFKKSFW